MAKKVVIIGAGLGGLFTGAILAKEGFEVTLLEKNSTIGGGLQTFSRFGEDFDTGMHIIGGMAEGGTVNRICKYLGILDQIKLQEVDDGCTARLYYLEDNASYEVAKGKEGFVVSLARYFPDEQEALQNYVEAIFNLAGQVDLFNLRPSDGRLTLYTHSEEFLMAADEFIAKYVGNAKLRSILAYMNPLYGGYAGRTPAYIHAIISALYINGTSRFVGGSSRFAEVLKDFIQSRGGRVLASERVEWVEVRERNVEYVQTSKGRCFQADYYISAIHPCALLGLTDEKAFPKIYRNRLNSIPNAYSAFSLFIKLKADTFPYMNYSEFYMTRYSDVWSFGDVGKPWPLGFLLMTPPVEGQGAFSSKVLVMAPMPFEFVRQWENTTVGKRGEGYLHWKEQQAAELLQHIEHIHPGFSACVERINTASPLTIRDFYAVKEGSISGFSKDCRNITLSQLPVATKARNLLLTGQNNQLHGFCGVPLTAITTCEAILGANYVINKINGCTDF
ncbi:MAG: NAD(P)/FAD-dependent oxidoreductase [Bacteroidaceae bacterium]|nr:NAD(P)/FAD-dependent oxidoreductase [Bacteroidaceae bacterium]